MNFKSFSLIREIIILFLFNKIIKEITNLILIIKLII